MAYPTPRPTLPRLLVDVLQLAVRVTLLALGIAVLTLLCTSATRAQPCTKVVPVQAQDPAPCTGLVMPEADAIKLGKCLAADLPECEKLLVAEEDARKADNEYSDSLLRGANERGDKCCNALAEAAQIVPPAVPWYQKPEFVAPVTAILTAVTAVVLTLAATGGL